MAGVASILHPHLLSQACTLGKPLWVPQSSGGVQGPYIAQLVRGASSGTWGIPPSGIAGTADTILLCPGCRQPLSSSASEVCCNPCNNVICSIENSSSDTIAFLYRAFACLWHLSCLLSALASVSKTLLTLHGIDFTWYCRGRPIVCCVQKPFIRTQRR